MVVDFHTHIFPDAIAERAIASLEEKCHTSAFTRGRLDELKQSMKEAGIDYSVVLTVMTKASQFENVNRAAAAMNGKEGIIAFGSLHPDCDDICGKLDMICDLGLKGIKLHPDYHNIWIDDPIYVKITDEAIKRGLIVLFHSGWDIAYPDVHHASADHVANLLNILDVDGRPESKIVLAHTGGWNNWDDVEKYLVGRNVYFDTSLSLPLISVSQMQQILADHGCDRIMFGTDSPWDSQAESLASIRALDLEEEELECILYRNAFRLLNLPC